MVYPTLNTTNMLSVKFVFIKVFKTPKTNNNNMEKTNQTKEDPRLQYISALIRNCENVRKIVYNDYYSQYTIMTALKGMIGFLGPEDKEKLKHIKNQINDYRLGKKKIMGNSDVLENMYEEIMNYIYPKYLQQFLGAKPLYDSSQQEDYTLEQE